MKIQQHSVRPFFIKKVVEGDSKLHVRHKKDSRYKHCRFFDEEKPHPQSSCTPTLVTLVLPEEYKETQLSSPQSILTSVLLEKTIEQ